MEFQSKAQGKRKGERGTLKQGEKTLFFSSPYISSAEAALHRRSGVSFMENANFKRGRRKGLGHCSPQPRELPGLFPSESGAGKVEELFSCKKVPKSLFISPLFGGDLAL